MKFFLDLVQFLYNLMQQLLRIENSHHLHFFGFIVAFQFFIQSGESIYKLPHLEFTLQHF